MNQGLDLNEEILEVKKEMGKIAEISSQGVIIRSKEREIEVGEKCTWYFFKKIISKGAVLILLKKEDGVLTANTEELKETVECFYNNLYKENQVENYITEQVLGYIDKTVEEKQGDSRPYVSHAWMR